ncbi:MAG: co-chaperone GroES [Thermotogota bacterium]|nr:co-chaperone GroES [Thermotogota bacterium]
MSKNINKSGIHPTGGHILVLPDPVNEKTEGGIFIPETSREKEQQAATSGTLISVGSSAWADLDDGSPWAKVGDRVLYGRYAGVTKTGQDETDYVLLNDNDILAVLSF